MEAGRELDAEIAEKVMGWVWLRHIRHFPPPRGREWWRSLFSQEHGVEPYTGHAGEVENIPAHGDEPMADYFPPPYSKSIAAAWTVVEKIKAEWIVTMEIDEHVTRVGFGKNYASTPIEFSQSAITAPLAICLAALEAVGIKEGDV